MGKNATPGHLAMDQVKVRVRRTRSGSVRSDRLFDAADHLDRRRRDRVEADGVVAVLVVAVPSQTLRRFGRHHHFVGLLELVAPAFRVVVVADAAVVVVDFDGLHFGYVMASDILHADLHERPPVPLHRFPKRGVEPRLGHGADAVAVSPLRYADDVQLHARHDGEPVEHGGVPLRHHRRFCDRVLHAAEEFGRRVVLRRQAQKHLRDERDAHGGDRDLAGDRNTDLHAQFGHAHERPTVRDLGDVRHSKGDRVVHRSPTGRHELVVVLPVAVHLEVGTQAPSEGCRDRIGRHEEGLGDRRCRDFETFDQLVQREVFDVVTRVVHERTRVFLRLSEPGEEHTHEHVA